MAKKQAAARRVGSATSKTRTVVLDGAEALMLEKGYAAVTYRSVAAKAGVVPGLVQYYFPTLDDLFMALLQRGTDRTVEELAETSKAEQPLRAIWKNATRKAGATLLLEFMALAHHREALRTEIGRGGERVRRAQLQAIVERWPQYGLDEQEISPAALLFAMNAIPRMLLLEEAFGTRTGHKETVRVIERFLDRVEPQTPVAQKR
jgi:AcrR family transcriptional regulator